MHFLIESVFVGIYTAIVYLFISIFQIENVYLLLFNVGFHKHFLAYYLNLQSYYCNHGFACKGNKEKSSDTTIVNLTIESIIEGLLFVALGSVLFMIIYLRKNSTVSCFLIGFILHSLFELIGIHKRFCIERCK